MPDRRPLVLVGGNERELSSGDNLLLSQSPTAPMAAAPKSYVDDVTASLTGGGQPILVPTTKNTAYTAAARDLVLADASTAGFTVTLPPASGGGTLEVKKVDSSTNVVTVAAQGSDTVGSLGAASVPIRLPDQAMVLQANGTNWIIVDGYQSLSSLDGRYTAAATVSAPPWAPSTAYRTGDLVWQASTLYRRIAAGTSGATFDSSQWDAIGPSGSGNTAAVATFPQPRVNDWIVQPASSNSSSAIPENSADVGAHYLPAGTYGAVAFEVANTGSTGAVAKIVAYADNTGRPAGSAIIDSPTIATTNGGNQIITLTTPLVVPAGGILLWAGIVGQGGASTRAQMRVTNQVPAPIVSASLPFFYESNAITYNIPGISGAAPTAPTSPTAGNRNAGRLAFRRTA